MQPVIILRHLLTAGLIIVFMIGVYRFAKSFHPSLLFRGTRDAEASSPTSAKPQQPHWGQRSLRVPRNSLLFSTEATSPDEKKFYHLVQILPANSQSVSPVSSCYLGFFPLLKVTDDAFVFQISPRRPFSSLEEFAFVKSLSWSVRIISNDEISALDIEQLSTCENWLALRMTPER